MKFLKKTVIFCISFILLFTVVSICLNYKVGIELSPTLTTCVYAFFGTELASTAFIRIAELKAAQTKQNQKIDEEENFY